MGPSREDRSAEQSVEIVIALAAGALVFVAILLAGWLVGGALGATTAAWGKPALWMGCVLGAAAVLWRLLCVRRNSGL